MSWHIYTNTKNAEMQHIQKKWLETHPPWRKPKYGGGDLEKIPKIDPHPDEERAKNFEVPPIENGTTDNDVQATIDKINAALLLRRPILITGKPGIGKSTLAYSLAYCLGLGKTIVWPINSKTELRDGLYHYDALDHLQYIQEQQKNIHKDSDNEEGDNRRNLSIDNFITLGPLGTVFYHWERPMVLLIDEIDKASYDLPNDLLHILEEGTFDIPELRRRRTQNDKDSMKVETQVWDEKKKSVKVPIKNGRVQMYHHPIIVMTSNGERTFPDAFLRRCIEIKITTNVDIQKNLIKKYFPKAKKELLDLFTNINLEKVPNDVVLQALHLCRERNDLTKECFQEQLDLLFQGRNSSQ